MTDPVLLVIEREGMQGYLVLEGSKDTKSRPRIDISIGDEWFSLSADETLAFAKALNKHIGGTA
mgnify:CR=1 FL=1